MNSEEKDFYTLEQKNFTIKTDKQKEMDLFLRIYNYDDFAISIYSKNENPERKFQLNLTLEELQRNRFFRIFLNTGEIMRELEKKIEKSFIIDQTNFLYLIIPTGLTIINEIIFEIKEIKTEEKIDEYKNIIEKLNEKLKEKDKIIEENKKILETLNKKLNEKEEENKLLLKFKKSSNILKEDENDLVINWLKNNKNNIKYDNISFELLYRASRDGDSASKFHELCDGKGPTIIFVKNEDDYRYGGFTSKKWKSSDEKESDPSSFLFSLTNKEKYLLKNENDTNAIYHLKNNGPGFGHAGYDLFIIDKCFSNKHIHCFSSSFRFDNNKMYNGKQSFCVKDYEVYLVKFN